MGTGASIPPPLNTLGSEIMGIHIRSLVPDVKFPGLSPNKKTFQWGTVVVGGNTATTGPNTRIAMGILTFSNDVSGSN